MRFLQSFTEPTELKKQKPPLCLLMGRRSGGRGSPGLGRGYHEDHKRSSFRKERSPAQTPGKGLAVLQNPPARTARAWRLPRQALPDRERTQTSSAHTPPKYGKGRPVLHSSSEMPKPDTATPGREQRPTSIPSVKANPATSGRPTGQGGGREGAGSSPGQGVSLP